MNITGTQITVCAAVVGIVAIIGGAVYTLGYDNGYNSGIDAVVQINRRAIAEFNGVFAKKES
jgi:hypothetical protein|nr:MAG TPA: hypothetical protein [Caudoviricetes sp.]